MFYSSTTANGEVVSEIPANVKVVNLENSSLKDYVEKARISEGTLIAIAKNEWGKLTFKEKQDVVESFVKTGEDKDFNKVHIINGDGSSVAFGSKDGVNIIE